MGKVFNSESAAFRSHQFGRNGVSNANSFLKKSNSLASNMGSHNWRTSLHSIITLKSMRQSRQSTRSIPRRSVSATPKDRPSRISVNSRSMVVPTAAVAREQQSQVSNIQEEEEKVQWHSKVSDIQEEDHLQ